jgi:N utilization substance protein B
MKPRTRARGIALQALYEIDLTGHLPGDVLQERNTESLLEDTLFIFTQQIVTGVIPLIDKLDSLIELYAPEWPLDQVAIIDRNILRIAIWEIAYDQHTPLKVVINEAVELAKMFGSDSTPRFVNGVLGSLALHQHEIIQNLKRKTN